MGFKASLIKKLPKSIQQPLRRWYYFRLLTSFEKTPEMHFLGSLIKKGDLVVDVGANIGVFTKHLSELVGPTGKVVSIEPIPSTFDLLRWNVRALKLKNVELFPYAVSTENGEVEMMIPSYQTGGDDFYRAKIIEKGGNQKTMKIPSKTLDSLLEKYGSKITFMKIDVEFHESETIQGAQNVIKNSMPILLVEVTRDPEDVAPGAFPIFNFLKSLGYQAFWFSETGLKKYYPGQYPPNVESVNYFFMPPS